MKSIGSVIKRIRQNHNISQNELAKKLGISRSQLSKLENDQANLSLCRFIAMCRKLKEKPENILKMVEMGEDI